MLSANAARLEMRDWRSFVDAVSPPNAASMPLDAAANVKRLPRHVIAVIRGEERHHIGHVVAGFHPAHRHLAGEKFARALAIGASCRADHLQEALEQLRLDETGAYRIDGNPELAQLQREAARQADNAVLRRTIRRHTGAATFARDRGSIDDASA